MLNDLIQSVQNLFIGFVDDISGIKIAGGVGLAVFLILILIATDRKDDE